MDDHQWSNAGDNKRLVSALLVELEYWKRLHVRNSQQLQRGRVHVSCLSRVIETLTNDAELAYADVAVELRRHVRVLERSVFAAAADGGGGGGDASGSGGGNGDGEGVAVAAADGAVRRTAVKADLERARMNDALERVYAENQKVRRYNEALAGRVAAMKKAAHETRHAYAVQLAQFQESFRALEGESQLMKSHHDAEKQGVDETMASLRAQVEALSADVAARDGQLAAVTAERQTLLAQATQRSDAVRLKDDANRKLVALIKELEQNRGELKSNYAQVETEKQGLLESLTHAQTIITQLQMAQIHRNASSSASASASASAAGRVQQQQQRQRQQQQRQRL